MKKVAKPGEAFKHVSAQDLRSKSRRQAIISKLCAFVVVVLKTFEWF